MNIRINLYLNYICPNNWEELVFKGLNDSWDGFKNDQIMQSGNYIVVIKAKTNFNEWIHYSGPIQLIR